MPSNVDETNQRILDMLEEKRKRRQGGDIPLVEQILGKNGSKPPKLPKLPKV